MSPRTTLPPNDPEPRPRERHNASVVALGRDRQLRALPDFAEPAVDVDLDGEVGGYGRDPVASNSPTMRGWSRRPPSSIRAPSPAGPAGGSLLLFRGIRALLPGSARIATGGPTPPGAV